MADLAAAAAVSAAEATEASQRASVAASDAALAAAQSVEALCELGPPFPLCMAISTRYQSVQTLVSCPCGRNDYLRVGNGTATPLTKKG